MTISMNVTTVLMGAAITLIVSIPLGHMNANATKDLIADYIYAVLEQVTVQHQLRLEESVIQDLSFQFYSRTSTCPAIVLHWYL